MKVEKQAFIIAMKKALPGIEKGSTVIEGADSFVFINNTVHSYNDSISVSVPFNFNGEISCSVKQDFFKLISKMPTDDIELESSDGKLKVNSGSTNVKMNKIESNLKDYIGSLKLDELTWKALPDNFFEAFKRCKINSNDVPQRGIFIRGDTMTSTDKIRINHHKLSSEMDGFYLDDLAVNELLKFEEITEYCIKEAWAHFKSSDGTIFSCKRKEESSYPIDAIKDFLEKFKKGEDDIENELPKNLFQVADRVATMSSEWEGLPAIKMTIKKDCIEFYGQRNAGEIEEVIALDKAFEKDLEMTAWMDPYFLTEVSKKVSKFYIKDKENGGKVFVFYDENYTQIVSTFQK